MKKIDVENWNRKGSYKNFIKYSDPIFAVSVRLDVTKMFLSSKKRKTSFFIDFVYALMKSINNTECLRIRLVNGEPVIFDIIDPSYIVMRGDESISTLRSAYIDDYEKFYGGMKRNIDEERSMKSGHHFNDDERNDVVFLSCIPWIDLQTMKNPYDYKDMNRVSIPRITWGKAVEEQGRYTMGFDIAAHHALIDGYQVSQMILQLQSTLNNWEL